MPGSSLIGFGRAITRRFLAGRGDGTRKLRRLLGSWDGTALAVGVVIGSGIFRTPGEVARQMGSVHGALGVWILGGVLATIDALIIAELATLFPRAGGPYVYMKQAYGSLPAFIEGWLSTLVSYPASVAGLAVVFSECVARLSGQGETSIPLVTYGVMLGLLCINAFGIQYGRATQAVFSTTKVALILGVVAMSFLLGGKGAQTGISGPAPASLLMAVGTALIGVLWTYDGYVDISVMAGEIRKPGRNIPRALIQAMAAITAVYLLTNVAIFFGLPFSEVIRSKLPLSALIRALLGPVGDTLVTIVTMVSVFGALNGAIMAGPRVTYAMARDGLTFRRLRMLTSRQTPIAALSLQVGMAILLTTRTSGGNAFDLLSGLAIFVIWLSTFFTSLSLVVFRWRYPDAKRPFRLPLYPYTFLLHILVSFGFLYGMVRYSFEMVKPGILILLAGIPAYLLWRIFGRPAPVIETPGACDPE